MEQSEHKFVEWSNFIQPDDVDVRWLVGHLAREGALSVLDVGGGNGRFAAIVARSGDHRVDVIDRSSVAAAAFVDHPGVRLIEADFLDWAPAPEHRYDLVVLRLVLHHLIAAGAAATRRTQVAALRKAADLLKPGGRIYVLENIYEPLFGRDLTARLIYRATRLRHPARLIRRLGANTAGEGVQFHSLPAWRALVHEAGLEPAEEHVDRAWAQHDFPVWQRWLLLCRRRYQWLSLLQPEDEATQAMPA